MWTLSKLQKDPNININIIIIDIINYYNYIY